MSETKTLAQLQTSGVAKPVVAEPMSFLTSGGFDQLLRVANMLSSSTMVPVAYRKNKEIKEYGQVVDWEDNPAALANCAVALNMAHRMNADPLMIMQNLHIIEGRPSWSTPFIIASINSCGRYNSLDYELSEPGEPVVVDYVAVEWIAPQGSTKKKATDVAKKVTVRHQTCKAFTTEKATGKRLESPLISIQMAIDEGWITKRGSKWQTMPELMLRYRCASFFGRLYAPELLMGLQSTEEVEDFIPAAQDASGGYSVNVEELRAQQAIANEEKAKPARKPREPKPEAEKAPAETVNKETGEITERESEQQEDEQEQAEEQQQDEVQTANTSDLPSFE